MVFITGATGLLGSNLVSKFIERGMKVTAQFHKRVPVQRSVFKWMQGDFSSLEGIREFIDTNKDILKKCRVLVNNFGPLTWKDTGELKSEDYLLDFFHNVIVSWEFMRFFIEKSNTSVIVNIGFEFAGEDKKYKKILSYAISKNSLLTITESCKLRFPDIRFLYYKTPELSGAEFGQKKGRKIDPVIYADRIAEDVLNELRE